MTDWLGVDMSIVACTVDGCEKPLGPAGMCRMHYYRMWRHGNVSAQRAGECKRCGKAFAYINKSGPSPTYCSEACRSPKSDRVLPDVCAVCGAPTGVLRGHRSYCSRLCQTEAFRHPEGRPQRDCIQCGTPIDFNQKRPGGRKLRADTRKCFGCRRNQVPEMKVADLAARDGSDCSICGKPVDFALLWPHRFSPSVDHVLPWSLGGGNEASNLALAHLTCNISKKNRIV